MPVVKRKFAYIGAGWVAGLLLFLALGINAAAGLSAALSAFCAVLMKYKKADSRTVSAAKYMLFITLPALLGALFFACFTVKSYSPVTALAGNEVTINGTVTDCSEISGGRTRITVKGRIGGVRAKAVVFTKGEFSRGERVEAKFTAKVPENTENFAAEDYYRSLGIFLTGSGSAEKAGEINALRYTAGKLRERALSGIYENCGEKSGAFLASVLCSDRSRLDSDTRNAVYRAGIGHIFAVSGTHIVMLLMFLRPLLKRLILPVRLRSAVTGFILVMFALFAGGSLPVIRACIMVGISLSAVIFCREADSANSLGIAAFVVTAADPFAVTGVSFWLSFTAAAAFGVLSPAMCEGRTEHPTIKHIVSCVCVNVLTLPVCAVSFEEVSLISAVSNVLLIPLCSACLCLALVFTMTGCLLTPLIFLADKAAGAVIRLCELVSASPYSYTTTEKSSLLVFWGIVTSTLFIGCGAVKERRPSDLAKCGAVYLAICILAAIV